MRDLKSAGRVAGSEMRFWMREVERAANRPQVRRPQDDVPDTPPDSSGTTLTASAHADVPAGPRAIGNWVLSEDPSTGALIASYLDGTVVTLATPHTNGDS